MMSSTQKKILVVDDTEATRYAVARTLKSEGFQVVEAANGQDALELVRSEKPDLVTLDIHLPDMLGFEVCRRIKLEPATTHIPVLQVSASYVTSKDRINGLEGGADSYLTHPFEPAVLIATIKALLRARTVDENLRITEERFRVALQSAPITISSCDLDLRYTWIHNAPGSRGDSGYLGKRDEEIFPPDQAKRLMRLKREVLDSGAPVRAVIDLTFDDEVRSFDTTFEPLREDGGVLTGVTIASFDITERRKSEEAQRLAFEAAEAANQAKTRFLSNMSHEIRTPLGVVQGFADLALEPNLAEADRNEYLLTIKRNAQNLTKLLGEILDLAKVEAGKIEIEKSRFSLTELISEIIEGMRLQAREKGISLALRVVQPFPQFVVSDITRLRQVVLNLVSNAVKFTERGGVELVATAREDGGLTQVEIDVTDSGIGLSAAQRARLFEAFVQADSSTTRKYGGTGLGLNLSKRLAQALGGDLTLEWSEEGRGSTFKFYFDAGVLTKSDYAAPAPAAAAIAGAKNLAGLRVLLVEDSIDNQLLLTRYLKKTGANVEVASDGLEGVEKGAATAFDVILMDLQMPNLDGYEATRELRGRGLTTPIVALTAHAMKEEMDRALSSGFTDYLTKPVNPGLLIETLAKLTSRQEK